jgi:hypothetical protein
MIFVSMKEDEERGRQEGERENRQGKRVERTYS